ncbi:MAG: DUF6263 family protein [Saprospiraceae bacterium]|nr:DUF6263 family protein [Saprospiraceae bacterium]
MKKLFTPLCLALCLGLFLTSCGGDSSNTEAAQNDNSTNSDNTTATANSTPAGNGESIRLKVNLNQGDKVVFEMTTVQDISQSMMGQSMDIKQTIGMGYTMEVTEKNADVASIKNTYDWMQYEMGGVPGMSGMNFDSRKDGQSGIMADIMSGMIGKSFMMDLNESGKVSNVSGTDVILEAMMEGVSDPAQKMQMRAQMEQQFGEEAMAKSMEQMMTQYPDKDLKVGDTWTQKSSVASGYPMIVETTYTVKSISANEVVLNVDGSIATEEGATMEASGMSMEVNLSGKQGGDLVINAANGLPKSAKMTQDIKGDMKAMGQEIPMSIKSTIDIVTKS